MLAQKKGERLQCYSQQIESIDPFVNTFDNKDIFIIYNIFHLN